VGATVDCVCTGPEPLRLAPGGTYAPGVRTTAENLFMLDELSSRHEEGTIYFSSSPRPFSVPFITRSSAI